MAILKAFLALLLELPDSGVSGVIKAQIQAALA